MRVVNIGGGVSREERILDDPCPEVSMDPHCVSLLDLGMKLSWAFATLVPSTPPLLGSSLPVEHQDPRLEGLLQHSDLLCAAGNLISRSRRAAASIPWTSLDQAEKTRNQSPMHPTS